MESAYVTGALSMGVARAMIHDIDCKDEKFQRAETPGVTAIVDGIVRSHGSSLA